MIGAMLALSALPAALAVAAVPPPPVLQRIIEQAASPTSTARPAATTLPAATAKAALPSVAAGFTGAAPASGGIGLLVTNQRSAPDGLVAALAGRGCLVEALAVLEAGSWRVYVPQAPAGIKARLGFPFEVGPTVAFFVRCA